MNIIQLPNSLLGTSKGNAYHHDMATIPPMLQRFLQPGGFQSGLEAANPQAHGRLLGSPSRIGKSELPTNILSIEIQSMHMHVCVYICMYVCIYIYR